MKGIYKITFENNKSYIGQSCNLDRRFSEYKNWKILARIKQHYTMLLINIDNMI